MAADDSFDAEVEQHPPLSNFDLSGLREPQNGLVYIFKSAADGFWAITSDPDIAQQDATGYPLGEIVEYEDYGDYETGEYGELRALEVADIDGDLSGVTDDD